MYDCLSTADSGGRQKAEVGAWERAVHMVLASAKPVGMGQRTTITVEEPVSGVLYVRNVDPSRRSALGIAGMFGTARTSSTGLQMGEEGVPYEVRSRNGGQGVQDTRGTVVLSSTDQGMDLHTDGYSTAAPPNHVILVCVHPGQGGRFVVKRVDEVVSELPTWARNLLMEPVYPVQDGVAPILTMSTWEGATYSARINLRDMWWYCRQTSLSGGITTSHLRALRSLEGVVRDSEPSWAVQFRRGDVLVIDNSAVLHGRSALAPGATDRLLYRVWVSAPVSVRCGGDANESIDAMVTLDS